jgi:hypothetical protein
MQDISTALYSHMATFPTTLPVAWPGIAFDPPNNPHIVVQLSSRVTSAETIQSHDRVTGTMNADVRWQKGVGTIPAEGVASDIAAYFPRGLRIANMGVTVHIGAADVKAPIEGDGWLSIPVVIPWLAFVRTGD